MSTPLSQPDTRAQIQLLGRVLERLAGEWREVRPLLALRVGSTWADVAGVLDLDRGSAQRLVRLGRVQTVTLADLELIPGAEAWQKIVRGVEAKLGEQHPLAQRLASACDRYEECLNALGGSRAAAIRILSAAKADQIDLTRPGFGTTGPEDARARLVDDAASLMGYSVALQFDLQILRLNPEKKNRIDLAMARCFLGCEGRSGALPFAHARHGSSGQGLPVESGSAFDGRTFAILTSGTSSPPPDLLSTGDATSQTVIVEPNWTQRSEPMNVSILQIERDAQDSPWIEPPLVYVTETLNRHPTRRLIMQRLVHRDLNEGTSVSVQASRVRSMAPGSRSWFDNLPEPATLQVPSPPNLLQSPPDFSLYGPIVAEVFRRLGWDAAEFASSMWDVSNPIPLAWYSFQFEKHG
jgi:hypothetical protein